VLADVGEGSVVGAGSVVTKPLPSNVIAAGVPAKVIRERFHPPHTTTQTSIEDPA
jgi:virginiamycin A acetyltransferase